MLVLGVAFSSCERVRLPDLLPGNSLSFYFQAAAALYHVLPCPLRYVRPFGDTITTPFLKVSIKLVGITPSDSCRVGSIAWIDPFMDECDVIFFSFSQSFSVHIGSVR